MITLAAFADEASASLDGQIAALQRNHIPYIELRGIDGKNIAQITCTEAEGYAARLRAAGIRVWSIGSPIGKVGIGDDFDAHLDLLHHICTLAKIFGTARIRMFSFYNAYDHGETVIARLRQMAAVAAEYGMTLCHENEKAIYGDNLARNLQLLDAVPALAYVYDPANFLEVGEPAAATLDALHHRAGYFHIKDVIAETGQLVPAGHGDGQIPRLIAMIGDTDRTLTLEPHLAVFEGYAQIDKTEMKNKYTFASNGEAFDAAVQALKTLLTAAGYYECKGEITQWKQD